MDASWIEYRRGRDRELLGWIVPRSGRFAPVSLLGRELSGPVDWADAEQALEDVGLGYLSGVWLLDTDEGTIRVRIAEVSGERIRVITDNFGAIDVPFEEITLGFPAPDGLRPA
ncbi:MAG: hypothetical protein LBQ92_01170 [Propionibacteriaceae bacterium]|nr:hypothetical protein [Propionibacteriaceae bacterium]